MEPNRRNLFTKIAMIGATGLAFMGASKQAKAVEGNEQQNPLLGLWDMTIPVQQQVGVPVPLYFKYAISEGGFVVTGNYDSDATFNGGFTFSPGMGTYVQTGPNSYRWRHQTWVFDASGNPAGTTDNFGTITVAGDGKTFSATGTTIQYDVNGNQVYEAADFVFNGVRFPA